MAVRGTTSDGEEAPARPTIPSPVYTAVKVVFVAVVALEVLSRLRVVRRRAARVADGMAMNLGRRTEREAHYAELGYVLRHLPR